LKYCCSVIVTYQQIQIAALLLTCVFSQIHAGLCLQTPLTFVTE